MNIDKLERVIAIYETGSFRKAAQQLGLSQPGLTWSIRQLEQSIDARLFHRGPNGVVPTDVCEQLIGRAKLIVSTHSQMLTEVGELNSSQHMKVGVHPIMLNGDFARCISRFNERFPEVTLKIVEGYSSVLLAALESGELDFAYCGFTETVSAYGVAEFEEIAQQSYSIIAAPSHPIFRDLSEGRSIGKYSWAQAEVPNLTVKDRSAGEIDEIFLRLNRASDAKITYTTSMNLIRLLVQEGHFLGLIADEYVVDQLASGQLRRVPGSQIVGPPIGFVTLGGSYETSAMQRLKSMLRQLHDPDLRIDAV